MESLLVHLPDLETAPASWLLVDGEGRRMGAPARGPLELATPLSAGRRVIALVPGVEVLLAEPELPVKGAKLAQVVPFALEEQLAEDVESMHFAVGRRLEGRAGTPVAAVSRARFEGWLARLRAANLEPHAVYVDSTAVPGLPGQTVLLVDGDRLYVRAPGELPVVLHAEPMAAALELAGVIGAPDSHERNVVLFLSQEDWNAQQPVFDAAREHVASLKVQLLPYGPLPLLAQEAIANPPLDLLQGAYARRTRAGEQWRSWRLAASLFAALVALHLIGKGVEIWRLNKEEAVLNAAIEQTFREAMPGQQNAVDARRRMEARLAAVRGGSTGDSLLDVMAVVGNAFGQVPETSIEALSYRANVLDMKVAAKDTPSLERLRTLIGQAGLEAEFQSSTARASGIEGRLQIKGAGAPSAAGTGE